VPTLGVNIDHVATVRQARQTDEPDPVWAATEAELGGADGITFHLREDRRHINDRDARCSGQTVATKLNMEMSIAAHDREDRPATSSRPVHPGPRAARGADHRGRPRRHQRLARRIKPVVTKLKKAGITTSAFIEPDATQIAAAGDCGFDASSYGPAALPTPRQPASVSRNSTRCAAVLTSDWAAT
jgi:pyridoxine 5-phosphate synthase